MSTPLISVITPVYNVEPYILDYLDSITNQTYDNLEIICVDDGSPDNCGKILDEYATKNSRFKVIHQQNAGYAQACNRGLDCITGDYVGFIDPDDWVEYNFYEEMLRLTHDTGADITISNFFRDYPYGSERMLNYRAVPSVFQDKNDVFRYGFEADVYRGFKMFLCNKLFRSRFFIAKEKGGLELRMRPEFSVGGDSLLTSQCFFAAETFAYTDQAFYHYRIRENSIVRSKEFTRRLGFNYVLEEVAQLLEERSFDDDVIRLVKRFHVYYCSQLAEFAYSIGNKDNLEFSKIQMKKHLEDYIAASTKYPDRLERINNILNLEVL